MRKINIANIISFVLITLFGLLTPIDMTHDYWYMLFLASVIANFILFIIASVKMYKGIKNELKEDNLYNIVVMLNTVLLVVLCVVIPEIPYAFEGWDRMVLLSIIAILIVLFIANSITFLISKKLYIKLYLGMDNIDENLKKSKKKKNIILNIILITIIVAFGLTYVINMISMNSRLTY